MKENEGYKVETKNLKGCRLALTITVKKEQVKKAYQKAIKAVNKEISMPGFRKGKAPDEAVIQKYGPHIEREWKEILVQDAFQAGLALTQKYPYNRETIDKPKIEKCSMEEGALISISYECYPEVPEVNFKDLALPHIARKKVKQEEVDEILKEVRQAHATWEEVPGKVKEGDWVDLSIDKIDEEPPHPLVQKRRFEVSSVMMPWLKSLVVGMSAGELAEGTTAPDEKASAAEKASYQPVKVRVTLHGIQKIILPEVDDELAKKVGATDKTDLETKIRANLERDADAKLKDEKIKALENLLIEKYAFEVPSSVLDNEIKSRTEERIAELRKQNTPEDQIKIDEIAEWAKGISEQSLRLHYLLTAIGEKGKVRISNEELNEKLNNEILRNPYYHQIAKENSEMLQRLIRRLSAHFQNEKIREYALAQVDKS